MTKSGNSVFNTCSQWNLLNINIQRLEISLGNKRKFIRYISTLF